MTRLRHILKRAPRVGVRQYAAMVLPDGREVPVVILNVSSGGFRIESQETLPIGEFVTLRAPHGEEVAAQIRWSLGHEAGGIFLEGVDYSQFAE